MIHRIGRRPTRAPPRPELVPPFVTPIHERQMNIDPQSESPFYNGRIPAEVRTLIFEFAATESAKTEPDSLLPPDSAYCRPGFTTKKYIPLGLLLTCRRVYLETYKLPLLNRTHMFHHYRAPPFGSADEVGYLSRFQPWQLANIHSLHLHTQMFWLERSFFDLCGSSKMQGIKHMKITIRRGDWWHNEANEPLRINPRTGSSDVEVMIQHMATDKASMAGHSALQYKAQSWGMAFGELAGLENLEMEFETSEDKRGELTEIVEWARGWRFPLKRGRVLSTERGVAEWMEWTGQLCHWSEKCPYCVDDACGTDDSQNEELHDKCRARKEAILRREGPLLVVAKLKWKLVGELERDRDPARLIRSCSEPGEGGR